MIKEITSSSLMTPYRALSMAVRNEERAFAFWSYVAAHADQGEIKRAAETMARQELEHVAKLRKERRRAYHEERKREGRLSGDEITSDKLDAGILEAKLAEHLEKLAVGLEGGAADRADELLGETWRMSAEASGFGRFPAEAVHRDPQAIAEMLIEAYLEGAEAARMPSELQRLQDLAQRSIFRLAWLRALA
jgi:rubrerythrin